MKLIFKESLGHAVIYQKNESELYIEYDPGYHGSKYRLQPITISQLEEFKLSDESAIRILRTIVEEFGNRNWWDEFEKPDDYDQP